MNQSTATIKSFSGLTDIKEVCAQLDFVFARLQDALGTNPSTHSLLDPREAVPNHVAGDFFMDYRDGKVTPGMSDGKNVQPFDVSTLTGAITPAQHGALNSTLYDEDGNPVGQMHFDATATLSGFMSAADKVKLTGVAFSAADPAVVNAGAGSDGALSTYARSDHRHQVLTTTALPASVAATSLAGTATSLARSDHAHAHGNQAGGALHANVTTGAAGFMSVADKTELDRLNLLNIRGHINGASRYMVMTFSGVEYAFGPGVTPPP